MFQLIVDVAFGDNYVIFLDSEGKVFIDFYGHEPTNVLDISNVKFITHSIIKNPGKFKSFISDQIWMIDKLVLSGSGILGLGTSDEETFVVRISSQKVHDPYKVN